MVNIKTYCKYALIKNFIILLLNSNANKRNLCSLFLYTDDKYIKTTYIPQLVIQYQYKGYIKGLTSPFAILNTP